MVKEKRLRILFDDSAQEGEVIIHKDLKDELDIKTKAELVISKKRFIFKVKTRATIPNNKIYGNPADLQSKGIHDNSITTIRAPLE